MGIINHLEAMEGLFFWGVAVVGVILWLACCNDDDQSGMY